MAQKRVGARGQAAAGADVIEPGDGCPGHGLFRAVNGRGGGGGFTGGRGQDRHQARDGGPGQAKTAADTKEQTRLRGRGPFPRALPPRPCEQPWPQTRGLPAGEGSRSLVRCSLTVDMFLHAPANAGDGMQGQTVARMLRVKTLDRLMQPEIPGAHQRGRFHFRAPMAADRGHDQMGVALPQQGPRGIARVPVVGRARHRQQMTLARLAQFRTDSRDGRAVLRPVADHAHFIPRRAAIPGLFRRRAFSHAPSASHARAVYFIGVACLIADFSFIPGGIGAPQEGPREGPRGRGFALREKCLSLRAQETGGCP